WSERPNRPTPGRSGAPSRRAGFRTGRWSMSNRVPATSLPSRATGLRSKAAPPPTSAETSRALARSTRRRSSWASSRSPRGRRPTADAAALMPAESRGPPLALGRQALLEVSAGPHATMHLLQVVASQRAVQAGRALHEGLHGTHRERRVLHDLVREGRDRAVE